MRITLALVAGMAASAAHAQVLLAEDFDGLTLRSPIDETGAPLPTPPDVWTDQAPELWYRDRCEVPAGGVRDWRGWNFSDGFWWASAAGDQQRSDFVFGLAVDGLSVATLAVADPDEWDDLPSDSGLYRSTLYSPDIAVDGVSSITIAFASSWRPECCDDDGGINNQTGEVMVSFDGGTPVSVLLWQSDDTLPNFKPDATNEQVSEVVAVPNGAQTATIMWQMRDAANDWWWAIDNVVVTGNATPTGVNMQSTGVCPPEPTLCSNPADFDGNNLINTNDFFLFLANYQLGCP